MGCYHRHFMAEVAAVEFISYEATLEKFQQEWLEIVKGTREQAGPSMSDSGLRMRLR